MATPQPLYTQGRGNEHLRGAIFGGKYISFLFFNWLPTLIRVETFIGLFVRMRTKSLFLVESGENMIYSKYIFHHPFHWKNIYYMLYNIFIGKLREREGQGVDPEMHIKYFHPQLS